MGGNTLSDKQRVWLAHIEACASAGGSMKVYAERHGLNLQRFYFWKGRLKKSGLVDTKQEQTSPGSLRVLSAVGGPNGGKTCIQLANGVSIEAPSDFDATALTALLVAALRLP